MKAHPNTKHGHVVGGRHSPTYKSWMAMRQRCCNPNAENFPRYGGAGIDCAPAWASFANFLADMGERPPHTSLDRVDNQRGYSKANCRWAVAQRQQRNTKRTRKCTFRGREWVVQDLADALGINYQTLLWRLRNGWTEDQIVSTQPNRQNRIKEART